MVNSDGGHSRYWTDDDLVGPEGNVGAWYAHFGLATNAEGPTRTLLSQPGCVHCGLCGAVVYQSARCAFDEPDDYPETHWESTGVACKFGIILSRVVHGCHKRCPSDRDWAQAAELASQGGMTDLSRLAQWVHREHYPPPQRRPS